MLQAARSASTTKRTPSAVCCSQMCLFIVLWLLKLGCCREGGSCLEVVGSCPEVGCCLEGGSCSLTGSRSGLGASSAGLTGRLRCSAVQVTVQVCRPVAGGGGGMPARASGAIRPHDFAFDCQYFACPRHFCELAHRLLCTRTPQVVKAVQWMIENYRDSNKIR